MAMKMKRFVVSISGCFVIILLIIMCIVFFSSKRKWIPGVYFYTCDMAATVSEGEVILEVPAYIVGEEYLQKIQNGTLRLELADGTEKKEVLYRIGNVEERKHYKIVSIFIETALDVGEYSFTTMRMLDNNKLVSEVEENIHIKVVERPTQEQSLFCQLTQSYCTGDNYKNLYIIENRGEEEVEIFAFCGEMSGISEYEIKVLNDISAEEGIVDLMKLKPFPASCILQPGRCMYLEYTGKIEEGNDFTKFILWPGILFRNAGSGESKEQVLFFTQDTVIEEKTEKEVLNYVQNYIR